MISVPKSKTFNLIKFNVLLLGTQINRERGEALPKTRIIHINIIIHSFSFIFVKKWKNTVITVCFYCLTKIKLNEYIMKLKCNICVFGSALSLSLASRPRTFWIAPSRPASRLLVGISESGFTFDSKKKIFFISLQVQKNVEKKRNARNNFFFFAYISEDSKIKSVF